MPFKTLGRTKRESQCLHHMGEGSQSGLLVVVNVKEIRVKQRLNDAGNNGHRLEGTLEGGFGEIAEDPVRDVECPIESQSKQIVGGDGVCLPGSLQHE